MPRVGFASTVWLLATRTARIVAVTCVLIYAHGAEASPILYGVSTITNSVYTINTSTGAATFVTNTPTEVNVTGAEFLNGELWVTDVLSGGYRAGTIDLSSGIFTPRITQPGSSNTWQSLAANESTDTLYTVDLAGPQPTLLSMTTSGAITSIGSTADIRGLAYDNLNGTLWGVNATTLFTINTLSGAATTIGGLGASVTVPWMGLAFLDNTLFLTANNALYQVNTSTGLATQIGANGVNGIDGLAAFQPATNVPETADTMALLLLSTGCLGLVRRWWRHVSMREGSGVRQ